MTLIGDLIPSLSPTNTGKAAIDLTYRNSCILLSDAANMLTGGAFGSLGQFIPQPLLGFVFDNPQQIELLKYQYSEYPYLNKALIVNSYVRQNTRFTLTAHRCITPSNPIPINIAANEAYYYLIKEYADRGGTFTIVTMWGTFSSCVLEELNGIPPEHNNGVAGTSFEFKFLKVGMQSPLAQLVSGLKSLAGGFL